ncbi:MAG: hypothetical protein QOG64_1400, partial [Acidimicrobiaceae bacterium]|nr:hypothetical protein [Acidimicrobiaceae bacterium]
FVYLISNGALDWGPSGVARTRAEMAAQSGRTAATTVRRVTRPEREPVEVG